MKADLRPRIAARIADAESRAAELAGFTAILYRALDHLDALPDRPGRCDPECGFLTQDVPAIRPVDIALLPSRQAAEADTERWRPPRWPAP